jgi:hypothetical protein
MKKGILAFGIIIISLIAAAAVIAFIWLWSSGMLPGLFDGFRNAVCTLPGLC